MLTIHEIQKQIFLARELLIQATESDDHKRIYELNTAIRCLKDCLIELLESELKQVAKVA